MAGGMTEIKVISAGVVGVIIVLHNVKKSLHFWFKNEKNLRLNWDYSETKKKKSLSVRTELQVLFLVRWI